MLKDFQELSLELAGGKKFRNKDCNQKLGAALTMAQEAERISIQERVNLFGFRSRYTGSDSNGEGKDLRLSGANSPDSCSEKEEEELELEAEELEEEEEKKNSKEHSGRIWDGERRACERHWVKLADAGIKKGGNKGLEGQCLVWVQCSSPDCEKWRRLCGNIDPSVLPDNWSCDQNTDSRYNRCDIPEESWTGRESDVAYASYIPGSIIWAKQYGYPWWPGMVESDPDLGEYFLFASHLDSLPSKYHVTFFGETVSRAWIPVNMLKDFQELSLELAGGKKFRNKDCNQKLGAALTMAQEAERISIQERVNLFGFRSRYTGSDSNGEGKDLRLSGANSPDSCSEKEEEELELEAEELEEEEEKKEAGSMPPDDEASSDLDLEQLLEDAGEELEQLEEPRCGDAAGEFTLAFFEE
ncbi:zinc finger CW-type PWWP domain protein 1-like [Ailuropoda melanoleuca]|uniref:zinc finger CW-type PWWP domain protein 1-like n=1 Tax=Ailuropoda melanoleuca TaxID=9646 RepID=UPI001494F6D6|nr:zinc finger CW-type PWWP domain protein 1-like [Ailuropoda melanoleuca]